MKRDINKEYIFYPYRNGIKLLRIKPLKTTASVEGFKSISELSTLPICLYFLSPYSEVEFMNEKALNVCGHASLREAYGRTIADVAEPESAHNAINSHQNTIQTNKLNIVEEDVFLKDSTEFSSITFLKPWYGDDNTTIGIFGCSLLPNVGNFTQDLLNIAELGILASHSLTTNLPILPGVEFEGKYLSAREAECLNHYIDGKSAKEIGKILNLSYRTVERYIENIKYKFNVTTKAELIAKFKGES